MRCGTVRLQPSQHRDSRAERRSLRQREGDEITTRSLRRNAEADVDSGQNRPAMNGASRKDSVLMGSLYLTFENAFTNRLMS
jgi:hypothetical protein